MEFINRDGKLAKVVSKELVAEKVPVYNIEVEEAHTYYIGKDGKSLLVHNKCRVDASSTCYHFICNMPVLSGPATGGGPGTGGMELLYAIQDFTAIWSNSRGAGQGIVRSAYISAGRTSAGAAEAAMAGERGAEEAYCAAVQEAAETANLALMVLADNADPTPEIVSYLLSMAQAETDAEIGRMVALGTYQVAVKQEYLAGLAMNDPRYLIALEDLAWTETTAAARNIYYEQLGAATMQYYSSVYSAMSEYNTTSRQLQNERTMMQLQREYANSARLRQNAWDNAERRLTAERTYEMAMLNAVFTKWENETNFEAEQAATLLANFQAGLDAVGDADAATAAGMYDNLTSSLSGWQVASDSALRAFRNEQDAVFNAAEAAARAAAAALERVDDAAESTDSSGVRAKYESQYYSELGAYALADAGLFATYLAAIETAQREFSEEQCRLSGLLADSIDTGVNNIADGTMSLDVQVCFSAGFEIDLADGMTKKIEEFEGGEEVWARPHDDPNGLLRKCKVVRVFKNGPKETIKVLFDNGLEMQATAEHPFFVPERGWTACGKLEIDDVCVDRDGELVRVVSKELVAEKVPVYNIEVEGAHTYYIGKDGKSLLVHNRCFQHPYDSDPTCIDCFKSGDKDVFFITPPLPSSTVVNKNVQQITGINFKDQQKLQEQARQLIHKEAAGMIDTGFPSGGTGGLNQITVGTFDLGTLGVGVAAKIDNSSAMGKYLMRHPTKFSRLNPMFNVYVGSEYTYVFSDNISASAGGRVGVRGVDDRGNVGDVDFNIGSEIKFDDKWKQIFINQGVGPDGYKVQTGFRRFW